MLTCAYDTRRRSETHSGENRKGGLAAQASTPMENQCTVLERRDAGETPARASDFAALRVDRKEGCDAHLRPGVKTFFIKRHGEVIATVTGERLTFGQKCRSQDMRDNVMVPDTSLLKQVGDDGKAEWVLGTRGNAGLTIEELEER